MRDQLADRLRHEARFIIHITWRDLPKRLSVTMLLVAIMLYNGEVVPGLVIGAMIALSEAIFLLIWWHHRSLGRDEPMATPLVFLNWLNNSLSTVAFCAPAIVLAGVPSAPMLIVGLTWIYGVMVHITNTFVSLPIFNRSQIVPCYAVLLAAIYQASRTDYEPAPFLDWMIVLAFIGIYLSNSVQTMTMQGDTQEALETARTEAQARLRELESLARRDPLTGLLNRTAFEAAFVTGPTSDRSGRRMAVMVIDLDGFKPINDSYGHEAGDGVLREVAARLLRLAGERGIAARLGGDEFALLRPDIPDHETALVLGRCVARDLTRPITHGNLDLTVGASVGVTLAMPGCCSPRQIINEADQAMYRAKSDPTVPVAIYDESFAPRLNLDDKRQLLRAMETGAIRPFYQPKVSLSTGRIVGFEALARWIGPGGEVAMPDSFLPQVAELGLHADLVEAILRRVVADLAPLREAGLGTRRIAINLPEAALSAAGVRTRLIEIAGSLPGAMGNLTLEITEDVLISRAGSKMQDSIAEFRRQGALISLDDFGTGFASFQHLRQLDFDELKIDRSFVAALCEDGAAAVLVEGFLSIARGLGVSVVAEGVETAAQEARLRALGCATAQGFRYGTARPLAETEIRLLAEGAAPSGPGKAVAGDRPDDAPVSPGPPAASPPPAAPGAAGGRRTALPYPRPVSRRKGGG